MKKLEDIIEEKKIYICESLVSNCQTCNNTLINKTFSNCVVFTLTGPKKGLLISKSCDCCKITYNCDHYIKNNQFFRYYDCTKLVVTSCQSVFEISLLENFDKHLLRNATTFSGTIFIF